MGSVGRLTFQSAFYALLGAVVGVGEAGVGALCSLCVTELAKELVRLLCRIRFCTALAMMRDSEAHPHDSPHRGRPYSDQYAATNDVVDHAARPFGWSSFSMVFLKPMFAATWKTMMPSGLSKPGAATLPSNSSLARAALIAAWSKSPR